LDALHEQPRSLFVVIRQAAVGEQVSVAGVQEQLRIVDDLGELACGRKIFPWPIRRLPSCGSEAGLPSAISPPNSEAGNAAEKSSAPVAPGRVCASSCAGMTPSEDANVFPS
jgi:hypothetical protein